MSSTGALLPVHWNTQGGRTQGAPFACYPSGAHHPQPSSGAVARRESRNRNCWAQICTMEHAKLHRTIQCTHCGTVQCCHLPGRAAFLAGCCTFHVQKTGRLERMRLVLTEHKTNSRKSMTKPWEPINAAQCYSKLHLCRHTQGPAVKDFHVLLSQSTLQ